METIKTVFVVLCAAAIFFFVFFVVGTAQLEDEQLRERNQQKAVAAQQDYVLNRFIQIRCRDNPRSDRRSEISCNHPAVRGAAAAGHARELDSKTAAWFNVCTLTPRVISVISFGGKCTPIITTPSNVNAMELTVSKRTDMRDLFNLRFYGRVHHWNKDTKQIEVNREALRSRASEFGGFMRTTYGFFGAAIEATVIVDILGILFFWWFVHMAYKGGQIRGRAGHPDDYKAFGAVVAVYFVVVSLIFHAYAKVVVASEAQYMNMANWVNNHYQTELAVGQVGVTPIPWGNFKDVLSYYSVDDTGHGFLDAMAGLAGFTWIFFIPGLFIFAMVNSSDLTYGLVDRFSSSRHKAGYRGQRGFKIPSLSAIMARTSSYFAAPFKRMYAEIMARKNIKTADELKARTAEVDADIEVAKAEAILRKKEAALRAFDEEIERDKR